MNLETALITGFTIGIVGSLHCVGMCGPIALGVASRSDKMIHYLFYTLGKALSYTVMGLVLGMIGNQFALAGMQQILTIVSGVIVLLIFFVSISQNQEPAFITAALGKFRLVLYSLLGNTRKGWFSFEMGVINGFLPCGLVYLALMTALATGDLWYSGMLMLAFGIGTMPILLMLMISGRSVPQDIRTKLNKGLPYLILIMGSLMILRGLNLGIPYLSPSLDGKSNCL